MQLGVHKKVDKIFGPGNQYVTAAKQLVSSDGAAIDMPAGPSEVLVLADDSAHPDFVAADLLSQAEHGEDSQVILVTTSLALVEKVELELLRQLALLPRSSIARGALAHSKAIVVATFDDAVACANAYAPEHLIIATDNARGHASLIDHAGSVFIGHYSPESAGDYASGTNHVLPTGGWARSYSGVSVDSFLKTITFQELTAQGLQNLAPSVEIMAEAESLAAHKEAISIRSKKLTTQASGY